MASVLIVDEAPINRRFVATLLRNHGHSVLEASGGEEAMQLARSDPPALMLIDVMVPGTDACRLMLKVLAEPGLAPPRVLLMAATGIEAETRALAHAFGSAFAAKPVTAEMLLAIVNSTLAEPQPRAGGQGPDPAAPDLALQPIARLVGRVAERSAQLEVARTALDLEIKKRIWAEQELTQTNRLLQDQAMRDAVTGLHNRRYLDESLAREESRARRTGRPMAVLMIDIDHFKTLNDTFGHAAGDKVLRSVGRCMASLSRGEDIAARYGGDEFALVMAQATQQTVWQRAEALQQSVRKLETGVDGQHLGPVTLSIGIALFPEHGKDGTAVLQAADAALMRSKQQGRNRVLMGGTVSA